jgi:uncharacterized protein YcnI
MSRFFRPGILAVAWFISAPATAHVSIWPRESAQGASEKYTIRVPTEGKVATTSAEVEAPDGVVIGILPVPMGWTQDVTTKDNRITSVTWRMNIPPGQFMEFSFLARNPASGSQIVWKLKQHFADGSTTDWTNGPDGVRASAVVKLTPAH